MFYSFFAKPKKTHLTSKTFKRFGTLLTYGDSVQVRFHGSIRSTKICKEVFTSCKNIYSWNYKNPKEGSRVYDGKDFNENRSINEIKEAIIDKTMLNSRSVALINFGLHPVKSLSLRELKHLFQSFLKMVDTLRKDYGKKLATIIWRNTTPCCPEKRKWNNITSMRFLTTTVSIFYFHI